MSYLLVVAGLVLLIFCGDALVRGAVGLSLRLNIPPLIVGLTVVSMGTSAPELLVCLKAAMSGNPGIAVGNVIGSNVANVLLVLGIPAIVFPIATAQTGIRRNAFMMLGATVVFIAMAANAPFGVWHGLGLVVLLLAFLTYSARTAMAAQSGDTQGVLEGLTEEAGQMRPRAIIGWLAVGIVGLPLGAELLVNGATEIARNFGVSDTVIGLTLVAIGTSLPELAATIVAAMRRHSEVAIGNVIGSNIFNILAIMGITALAAPIPVESGVMELDVWVMLGAAILVVFAVLIRRPIGRVAGLAFTMGYGFYVAHLLFSVHNGGV